MDWDDEYDFDPGETNGGLNDPSSGPESLGNGFQATDFTHPASAYFLLSDDAQDEISGHSSKRMKCRSCGHHFTGDTYGSCPECFSSDTEEDFSIIDGEEVLMDGVHRNCLNCGQAVGQK